jgi:hypothetical protein
MLRPSEQLPATNADGISDVCVTMMQTTHGQYIHVGRFVKRWEWWHDIGAYRRNTGVIVEIFVQFVGQMS